MLEIRHRLKKIALDFSESEAWETLERLDERMGRKKYPLTVQGETPLHRFLLSFYMQEIKFIVSLGDCNSRYAMSIYKLMIDQLHHSLDKIFGRDTR